MTELAKCAALRLLNSYLCHGRGTEYQGLAADADRQRHSFILECCAAHELGMLLWEHLPPAAFEKNVALERYRIYGGRRPDDGIDCADAELNRAAQVKWYGNRSRVCWRTLSTFHTLSTVAGVREMTLATSVGTKVHRLLDGLPISRVEITDERIDELVALARTFNETPAHAQLTDEDVDELLGFMEETSAEIGPPPLYKWQEEAATLLCESLTSCRGETPVLSSIACGSGKSRMIIEIIIRQGYKKSVVYVPAIALLDQFRAEVKRWAPHIAVRLVGGGSKRAAASSADEVNIIVCTYQSSTHIADLRFDFAVVDEAHHVAYEFTDDADDEGRFYASEIREHCLRDKTPVLLVSATLPVSLEDKLSFSYELGEAVKDGTIVDYNIVIPIFTTGDRQAGLRRLLNDHPEWTRVLAYCNSVKSAKAFADSCRDAGIKAAWFCAETPLRERRRIMDQLASGQLRLLATVHTLGEGVDIKEADTCMFVEPRGSHVDVVQCVGRVLRTSPGKPLAAVISPGADEEEELMRFLRLMSAADVRLKNSLKSRGRISMLKDNSEEDSEQEAELLGVELFDRLGSSIAESSAWDKKLELLKAYVQEFGKLPASKAEYRGMKLGSWVDRQRRAAKGQCTSKMTPERKQALEAVPGWFWDLDQEWQASLEMLKAYVQEFGKIPAQRTEYRGSKIGSWANHQRQAAKGQSRYKMTPERKQALEAVPGWFWKKDLKQEWQDNFELLKAYVQEFGKIPAKKAEYRGVKLGSWVHAQRGAAKGQCTSKMTPERKQALEEVPGWKW